MRGTSITTRRWGRRLGVLVAVLTFLGAAAIPSLRFLLGRQQTITSPSGINEAGYVRIGGIPQWIDVRGWNRTNPVILWLHGGPGAVVLPASYASFLPWEHEFTLAHWHQRGAGLTSAATPDTGGPLTIDRMANDGIEVAEHLRRRLGAKTIILIGHSWGTVLGTHMAQRRPDLFAAYVGTGQMNSLEDDGKDLFTNAMTRAVAASNTRAIDALTAVD
ncbi:MAG TPA: alpha/beta hydrolase, partial [Vicinamibacterales bacterium]|nr:alpha/beta hydrolase [Vicinamibacterales bacterium]